MRNVIRFNPLYVIGIIILGSTFAGCTSTDQSQNKYNVVFFLVDDMGYADIGAYGNTYHKTPNIDQLARDGMRFTHAYAAAPNCSPTRASILTGQWPARTGITQYLPGNSTPYARLNQPPLPVGLHNEIATLARPLKGAGYRTASIGKWHLGGGQYGPAAHGFDVTFAGGHWNAHESMFAPHPYVEVPDAQPGDYLTDRLTDEALQFINEHADQPFFLYLPYYAIHGPIEAKETLIQGYSNRSDSTGRNNAVYAAMTEGIDQSVGRIIQTLDALNLTDRTVIFFFSDNGGVPSRAFNGPFKSGKGFLWEGGIRVPLLIKWPGIITPGTVSAEPVTSVDFFPTILDIGGVSGMMDQPMDGLSLLPLLTRVDTLARDAIYWHYPHYSNAGATPTGAIRAGPWKLIEFFEDNRFELYHLLDDPAESTDLSEFEPAIVENLRIKLSAWRIETGALPADRNPSFDPTRASQKQGLRYKPRWDETSPLRE